LREIFLKVQGPSHMYLEHAPPEWPVDRLRQVVELRDALQKERLRGVRGEEQADELLRTVRAAEQAAG